MNEFLELFGGPIAVISSIIVTILLARRWKKDRNPHTRKTSSGFAVLEPRVSNMLYGAALLSNWLQYYYEFSKYRSLRVQLLSLLLTAIWCRAGLRVVCTIK
jgi:hypothetical protein